MSYSFTVRAATKAAVKPIVAAELDKVVASQPIHATDAKQALAAAEAFIDLVPDEDGKDITVSVSGSIGWYGDMTAANVSSASVGVSAYLVAKMAA